MRIDDKWNTVVGRFNPPTMSVWLQSFFLAIVGIVKVVFHYDPIQLAVPYKSHVPRVAYFGSIPYFEQVLCGVYRPAVDSGDNVPGEEVSFCFKNASCGNRSSLYHGINVVL